MRVAVLIAALGAGAGLGAAHFGSLWWSVGLLRGERPMLGVALQFLRFVVLAIALALIAREGSAPFLAAAAAVIVARTLLMRRYRGLA